MRRPNLSCFAPGDCGVARDVDVLRGRRGGLRCAWRSAVAAEGS